MEFQPTTYVLKRMQAEKFKSSGYDETIEPEVPFVAQYADFADLSMKQAADDIIFKAKLDQDMLLRTEGIRLKYFRLLRDSATPQEVMKVVEDFRRENYFNSLA